MKVIISIIVEALGAIRKNLEKKLRKQENLGKIEPFWTTIQMRSARILRRLQENWRDLQLLEL